MKTNQLIKLFLAFILTFGMTHAYGQSFNIINSAMCDNDGTGQIVLLDIPEPVTVTWEHQIFDEQFTGMNPTNLIDGSYVVTVTDVNGVQYTQYAWIESIIQWYPMTWPAAEAPCPGGTATTDIAMWGGDPDYDIYIDGNLDGSSSDGEYTTSPLEIGSYTVEIRDANGCRSGLVTQEIDSSQIVIAGVTDLDYEFEYTEISCGVYEVTANLVVESTPPYVNYWRYFSNGSWIEEFEETITITPGTSVQYHTTDANGCEMTFNDYFNPPNVLQAFGNTSPAVCPEDNGWIDMSIWGGTEPYSFTWSNGATTEDISGLAYGNYTLTVEDAEGCSNTFTKHVSQTNSINVTGTVIPPNCEENIAGAINVSVTGGVAPYSYEWNTGETTEDISFMNFGYYYLTVTDAEGCVDGMSFSVPISDPCYSYVSGTSYYDLDGNCAVNTDDFPINSIISSTNGNYAYYYGNNTNYTRRFIEDIELTASLNGYDLICPAEDVSLTYIPNEHYTDVDFYLQPQTLEDDVCVTVWASNPVPGFYDEAYIYASNPGTTVQPVTVSMEYTTLIDFMFSSPAPSVIDEDAGIITWDLGMINPNSGVSINIDFYTEPTVQLGEEVTFTATLGELDSDINTENNSASAVREVIGSYDPNDKQVTPSGEGETHMIDPLTDELQYRVRFQNTGTAPAVNVVIEDEIDISTLNIQSLEVLSTSHNLTDIMYDDNKVLFTFANIFLPDSVADLEGSQGFITFKIKVNEGLPLGTVIENDAAIFFDFNEPIITNTAFVTLDEENSITEELNASFEIFPNPSTSELNVTLDREIEALEILDITGKVVYQIQVNSKNPRIDLPSSLENGMYLVKIYAGNYIGSKELALQR